MRELNMIECQEISGGKFAGYSLDPLRSFLGNHGFKCLGVALVAAAIAYTYFTAQE